MHGDSGDMNIGRSAVHDGELDSVLTDAERCGCHVTNCDDVTCGWKWTPARKPAAQNICFGDFIKVRSKSENRTRSFNKYRDLTVDDLNDGGKE